MTVRVSSPIVLAACEEWPVFLVFARTTQIVAGKSQRRQGERVRAEIVHPEMGDHSKSAASLKRDNHFLPVCYQKGFADSSGRVWVKFVDPEKAVHCYPKRVGKEWNLYLRNSGGVEDDKFEDFFDKHVENAFAKLSQRVKREQNHLSSMTGKELGALGNFVAAQIVRTPANKLCMREQVGRELATNEFTSEMGKQMRDIMRSWTANPPAFEFRTALPYVEERFITGDNPVLTVAENDNPIPIPVDEPHQAVASVLDLLNNPKVTFRVALSPYICVFLHAQGGGEAQLPPQTTEPSEVRSFNDLIRKQCRLFTLARDEESLA